MLDDMLDEIGHMSCDDRDWFLSLGDTDKLYSIVMYSVHMRPLAVELVKYAEMVEICRNNGGHDAFLA